MDICDLLKNDLDEVVALARQLTQTDEPQQAKDLYRLLRLVLSAHARAEESVVYDALHRLAGAPERLRLWEREVEHSLCDHLLAKMTRGRADHPGWRARAAVMHALLVQHVDTARQGLLQHLAAHISPAQRAEMAARYAARRDTLMRQRS